MKNTAKKLVPVSLPGALLASIAPAAKVTTEIVDVTPELARQWLETNQNNRNISRWRVEAYSRVMKAGGWTLNNQGIGFDAGGILVDGQHRLHAVIASGVTVPMLVVRGLDPKSAATIDRGFVRTIGEVLRREGVVPSPRYVASWAGVERALLRSGGGGGGVGSVEDTRSYYDRNRKAVVWALGARAGSGRLRAAPLWGALVFAYAREPKAVEEFGAKILVPDSHLPGSPVMTLRECILNSPVGGGSQGRSMAVKTLRAVQAYAQGESLRKLYEIESAVDYFAACHRGDE